MEHQHLQQLQLALLQFSAWTFASVGAFTASYFENDLYVMLLFQCVTSCLLCAEFRCIVPHDPAEREALRLWSGRVRTAGTGVEQIRDEAECCCGAAGEALLIFLQPHYFLCFLLKYNFIFFLLYTQMEEAHSGSVHI